MSDEKRVADPVRKIENSILKVYRSRLWAPFINAVKQYELIQEGDRIAVCISGGKDSMLMAKLMQMLCRYSDFPFSVEYLVMDPGYNKENRRKIEDNARLLGIPITVFETNVFEVANMQLKYPCYLCAKMRRGYLYRNAKNLGCNKIALGHHLNDVIETVLMGMFYSSQIQTMPPKLHSRNFEKMELIRPLYCIREDDIIAWRNYNGLDFLQCACSYTERNENGENESKRKEIKELIRTLRRTNPDIEESLFNSVHNVSMTTFPGYRLSDGKHSFLEKY